MRCIVHIGIEKTGSTSLQGILRDNRLILQERGICFAEAVGSLNSRALAAAFVSQDRTDDYLIRLGLKDSKERAVWSEKLLDNVRREIDAVRLNSEVYLLSSEHLSSQLIATEEVLQLGNFLRSQFEDIQVVCYLRRQDHLAVSRFSQSLRAGYGLPQIFPNLSQAPLLRKLFDFAGLADRWINAFGQSALQLRIYEPNCLLGGDTVRDFVELVLKLNLQLESGGRTNTSLSEQAQLALKIFNVSMGKEHRRLLAKPRRRLVAFLEERAPGTGKLPVRNEAMEFYENFKAGNDRLAQMFFGKSRLFNEDFTSYPTEASEEDIEVALDLLSDFYYANYCET